MRRPWGRLLAGALAAALLAAACTGCAQSMDPIERLGKKAAQKAVERAHPAHGPERSGDRRTVSSDAAARPPYRRWGLRTPLAGPPHPDRDPAPHAVRVVADRIPTRDKVVFLTYDVTHEDLDTGDLAFAGGADGYDRDPRFVTMIRELRLPVSVFLTDGVVGPGYVQAERLREAGAAVQSRTLDRASLRGLPYEGQRAEICAQRDRLDTRLGLRPTLLRPPHGTYDTATVRAAATCGLTALVTGGTPPAQLPPYTPGQIIDLTRAGTSLTAATTTAVRKAQGQGFTVGRLEDYL